MKHWNVEPAKQVAMTDHQENRMSMFLSTQKVMQENQAKWAAIPALVQANADFDAGLSALKAAVNTQVKDLRGHTQDKRKAEDTMIALTLKVSGAVMAWAEVDNNLGLAEEMNVVVSELRNYRDAVVAERCRSVHDQALTNLAALADYGLVAADTTALLAAIEEYEAVIALPRMMVTIRKSATSEIGFLIRDTMRLLTRRMDRLMRLYELSDPTFHRTYTNARIIIDLGGQKAAELPAVA